MAKSKFTTTVDTELLKQAKIEAIQLDMSVAEFLEKQGFVVVDDNELEESWKTYHILRET